jgi:hypothetical protein
VLSSWRAEAVIGHGPNRAADGQLNPEQTHFVVFGKAPVLDGLTLSEPHRAPARGINAPIRPHATRIIHLAISRERAVTDFVQGFNNGISVFRYPY